MFHNMSKDKFESIHVNDLEDLLGKIDLVDIREDYEYRDGHVPTAKNIPMATILKDTDKFLDKSKKYYIICQSGARSSRTCGELALNGYDVVNIGGGTGSYIKSLER
jgi:rhodanese-related sulfurtransferase